MDPGLLVPEAPAAVAPLTAPRRAPPAVRRPPPAAEIPDIHGWPAERVQGLQQAAAKALGVAVVFRDPDFRVRAGMDRVQTGWRLVRKHWFRADEYAPVYEKRERILTIRPPEMVVIPAGRFLMGSPEGEAGRLAPREHRPALSSAERGRMGICLPGRDPHPLPFRRVAHHRPGELRRQSSLWQWPQGAVSQGDGRGREPPAQSMGALRDARQRPGVVRGFVRTL